MAHFTSAFDDIELIDQSITQRVFDGLKGRLDEDVLIDGPTGRAITAGALMDAIKRLAGGLTQRGLGKGHTIALLAPNIPEYCTIFHGVAWAGGTITTINPTYTENEIRHQLTASNAEILITIPDLIATARAAIEGTGVSEIVLIGGGAGAVSLADLMGEPLADQVPVDLDQHVVLLPYSSGTTGLPKGVMLTHRNLVANVEQTLAVGNILPGEITPAFLPFFHIYGLGVLMNTFLAGRASLVTMPRFDLETFLRMAQDCKARALWIVPPVALALAKHPLIDQFDLSSVEMVNSAAAPLGAELSRAVGERLNCAAVQAYGMTELSPASHVVPWTAPRAGSVGLTVPGTTCRIVDTETGADLECDKNGELWIKGPQVMKGYLNNPEATSQTIDADGWLHTGDIGYFDSDGYLYIVDRLKELIKFKGFQVAPAELEAVLLTHPAIADAAVIGVPDEEAGEVPMAFLVTANGTPPTDADIQAHLAAQLAPYKQVRRIEYVDSIPKSASGKILRRLLRDRL